MALQRRVSSRHGASRAPARDQPRLNTALRIITFGAALAAGAWLLYFMAVTLVMPYPIEYREGAAQVLTQLLLAGQNPFAPQNQPLGMTNYGIVFSLAVWPLARCSATRSLYTG